MATSKVQLSLRVGSVSEKHTQSTLYFSGQHKNQWSQMRRSSQLDRLDVNLAPRARAREHKHRYQR